MTRKGIRQTLEHKIKRGLFEPKIFSEEHCKNISKAKKGTNKFQQGQLRPIVCCSICGTMKVVKPSRVQYYNNFLCSKECKSIFYTGYKWSQKSKIKRSIASKLMWKREGFRENYNYRKGENHHWHNKPVPETMKDEELMAYQWR